MNIARFFTIHSSCAFAPVLFVSIFGTSQIVFAQEPGTAQPELRNSEIVCNASDAQERLPVTVRLRILSPRAIEARGMDKGGKESGTSLLRKFELSPQTTRAAVFLMGGQLGVSGDARLLIAQTALDVGEVGTIMIVNESTRENQSYQCQVAAATTPAPARMASPAATKKISSNY